MLRTAITVIGRRIAPMLATFATLAHADQPQVKPEDIVMFLDGGIACARKDELLKFIEYTASGQETKLMALMFFSGQGGTCAAITEISKQFKVISAEYNIFPRVPTFGLLEIVAKNSASGQGTWTSTIGAKLVRPAQ